MSTATVATVLPGPSSWASCSAAVTFRPLEVPANIPSSFARRARHLARGSFFYRADFIVVAVFQMRRPETCGDSFNAVWASFSGSERRRSGRLERYDAGVASRFFKRAGNAHEHPGGAYAATKGGQGCARLFGQFPADGHVPAKRIGIVELIGVEGGRLLCQFFGAAFHFLVKLGDKFAVLSRKNFEVCRQKAAWCEVSRLQTHRKKWA